MPKTFKKKCDETTKKLYSCLDNNDMEQAEKCLKIAENLIEQNKLDADCHIHQRQLQTAMDHLKYYIDNEPSVEYIELLHKQNHKQKKEIERMEADKLFARHSDKLSYYTPTVLHSSNDDDMLPWSSGISMYTPDVIRDIVSA